MATLMDEMVITDGNALAFETILGAGRNDEGSLRAFVWGPKGSGKSSMVQARGREKDLLSTKRIVACHGQEIIAVLKSGINEGFLDEIGEVDVLLIDGFESLFTGEAVGKQVAQLLLEARNARGLDTIVVSDAPLEDLDTDGLQSALEGYVPLEVQKLDDEGLVEFADKMQASVAGGRDDVPVLADDALRFIAVEFAKEPDDIRNAVKFLLTKAEEAPGAVISAERAKELLGA